MRLKLGATIVILLAGTGYCFGQESRAQVPVGRVFGQVLDQSRRPVKGAIVSVMPKNLPLGSAAPRALTDAAGNYEIRGLRLGSYLVFYEKPADGYPPNDFSFYSGGRNISVELTESHPAAHVPIVLGPKGANVIGQIIDDATGLPLEGGAGAILRRADNPALWVSNGVSSTFNLLVPSDLAFTITFEAKGYEPFAYGTGPGSSIPKVIRLSPETSLKITVKLKKSSPAR